MLTIINYGLGNVRAFQNAYKRMNVPARIATTREELKGATHVIVPGVGTFDHAMELLNASGMRRSVEQLASEGRAAILGVCVGMQILGVSSEEGNAAGLGWIDGRVRSLRGESAAAGLPMPHMGWNDISPEPDELLFKGLDDSARFYFLHSFYMDCGGEFVAARARYGINFASAVRKGRIFGVQFHPEKSHAWGAKVLKNFSEV